MNIYGNQIWHYSISYPNKIYISCRKVMRRFWKIVKIPYKTHNKFIYIVNNCVSIDVTVENRCNKYLWNLINSKCKLYNNMANLTLNNVSTTIDENIRFFTYTMRFEKMIGMNRLINIIYKKIDNYNVVAL